MHIGCTSRVFLPEVTGLLTDYFVATNCLQSGSEGFNKGPEWSLDFGNVNN